MPIDGGRGAGRGLDVTTEAYPYIAGMTDDRIRRFSIRDGSEKLGVELSPLRIPDTGGVFTKTVLTNCMIPANRNWCSSSATRSR